MVDAWAAAATCTTFNLFALMGLAGRLATTLLLPVKGDAHDRSAKDDVEAGTELRIDALDGALAELNIVDDILQFR